MGQKQSQTGGYVGLNDETAARNMLAADLNRAAYFWMVMDPAMATVLIAEYDVSGNLHRLAEILTPPPYMWCAQSYRVTQGVLNQNILIPVGYQPIWANRVREMPDGTAHSQLIFGRRNIATQVEEVILFAPDGSQVNLASMQAAIAH